MMVRMLISAALLVQSEAWADPSIDITSMSDAKRREFTESSTREVIAQVMRTTSQASLLSMSLRVVNTVNTYRYRMLKQERVRGTLLPEQTIDVFVREQPFAVRLHYVRGPSAGRKVVFNPSVRALELRVREGGFLSVIGALWVGVESSMAKADSNHDVREAGLGPLLGRLLRDSGRAKPLGGFQLFEDTWTANGDYCGHYRSPNATPPFDYATTRVCTDLASGIPTRVEGYGTKDELLEKWHFFDFKPHSPSAEFFNPEAAQL